MDALLQREGTPLRLWLQSANGDAFSDDALRSTEDPDVRFQLDHSIVVLQAEPDKRFPRRPWRTDVALDHTELIHHAIKRLLQHKQVSVSDSRNLLTLGYREVLPGATGHRVAHSNDVMCHYPNTLVGVFKRPCWQALHQLMGDALMIHLLLHYAIFAKLRQPKGSYMQICGKSICFTPIEASSAASGPATGTQSQAKPKVKGSSIQSQSGRVCSINEVLYSRHEQEHVFGRSHALTVASKLDLISRGAAERVIRSIFTRYKSQKRLPKRFIRLIPIIQELIGRFKAVDSRELAKQIVRVPPMFRKYMSEHPKVKLVVSVTKQERREEMQGGPCHPMELMALNDGYISQDESLSALDERKRKRRLDAIQARSNASSCSGEAFALDTNSRKKRHRPTAEHHDSSKAIIHPISPEHKQEIAHLLQFTVPKRKICRLVGKFVASVVPKAMWGSPESNNWKCVKKMIRRFIFGRKYDVLSIKQSAYDEFHVKSINWMNSQKQPSQCPPNELSKRHELVQELLSWVLNSLVFPLLRDLFYITECEGAANEIVFFQRSIWKVISSLVLRDLGSNILHPVHHAVSLAGLERKLGTSRLRLLPKVNGIRPLMNLSSCVDPNARSVNRSLEMVHRVLVFELERQSKRLTGASVRNLDEIYARLKPLILQIRSCAKCMQRRKANPDAPLLYCASVDIAQCFDNIRPAKLYQILKKIILEDEYLVRKHWVFQQAVPTVSMSSLYHKSKSGSGKSKHIKMERPAFTSGDLKCFEDVVADCRARNVIFVDGVLYDYLTKEAILRLLKEHLLSNFVQYQNRSYVQRQGIPQGSVLSTTLCNIYMAHFERRVLWQQMKTRSSDFRRSVGDHGGCQDSDRLGCCSDHEALLRYTDDFLFLSSDVSRANGFINQMHQGNDEYGCYVNSAKSRVNFEAFVVAPDGSLHSIHRFDSGDNGLLAWCGLLLDPKALQIGINLEKLRGPILQASIPLNETKALHTFLITKSLASIRQRWHALYFDPTLLSRATIHTNVFQALAMAAMRFVLLLSRLPRVNQNKQFFFVSIRRILNKTARGIYRSLQRTDPAAHRSSARDPHERTQRWHMYQALQQSVWRIGLHAFALVLRTKLDSAQQRYRALWLELLRLAEMEIQQRQQKEEEELRNGSAAGSISQEELQLLATDPRNLELLDWIQ